MLLGTIFFSIGAAAIKMTGGYVPFSEIVFARGVIGLFFCLFLRRKAGVHHLGKQKPLLIVRGVFGACSFFCMISAFVLLPLADATVIIFLHPVLVAVLASFVLKEKLPPSAWLCILASLIGVTLVTKPGFLFPDTHHLNHLGVVMAFAAVVCSSLAILAVRQLAKTEHPGTIMLYPLLVVLVVAPLADGANWIVPSLQGAIPLLLSAIFMNAGQYYMTKGYALGKAATISAVGYLEIVFAAIFGLMFFNEIPDMLTIAGSVVIVASTYLLGHAKQG